MSQDTKVRADGSVENGPPCPGAIQLSAGGNVTLQGCGRPAIFVVEDRTKFKCAYGHRWNRGGA